MFQSGLPGKESSAPQCQLKIESAAAFPPNIYTVRPHSSTPGTSRKVGGWGGMAPGYCAKVCSCERLESFEIMEGLLRIFYDIELL